MTDHVIQSSLRIIENDQHMTVLTKPRGDTSAVRPLGGDKHNVHKTNQVSLAYREILSLIPCLLPQTGLKQGDA